MLEPYPAPMTLLSSLMAKNESDAERYETIIVPFLDRVLNEYPIIGMPKDVPSPELSVLVEGWNIEVLIGDAFKRAYRRAESSRTIVVEFPAW